MANHETYRMDIVVDVKDGQAKVELKDLDKEIVKTKKSGDALNRTNVTPKADGKTRTELSNMEKVMVSAKKRGDALNRTRIDPTISMQDRISSPLKRVESNIGKLTRGSHKVVLEGVDRITGVVKRVFSALTSPLALIGMGGGAVGMAALVKDFFMTAGRTETLNIAMESVARSTGTSTDELMRQRQAVMDLGIAEQEASHVMTRFMQGSLDIAQAAKVARVAQDAAVIAGVNSSEATETMVEAIAKLSPELLSSFGMTKNMNDIFADYADQMGIVLKTTDKYGKTVRHMTRDMTEAEKKQAMLNYVLEEGAKISGTYEGAMGAAFKKMGSLARYWTDFKTKVGAPLFLAGFGAGIDSITDMLKRGIEWANTNQDVLEGWGKSIETTVKGTIDRVIGFFDRLATDETFKNLGWGDKFVYLLNDVLDSVIDWIDGPGGGQVQEMFMKLGGLAAQAWWTGLKGMAVGSVQAAASGNLLGALGLGAGAMLLGGGMLVRGGMAAGKGLLNIGKKAGTFMDARSVAKVAALETTNPLAASIARGTYGAKAAAPAAQAVATGTKAATTGAGVAAAATQGVSRAAGALGSAAKVAGKVAIPIALAAELYDISKADNKAVAAVKSAGGLGGGAFGAKVGAAIGTAILPGIGTAIGGVIGGVGGYVAGKSIVGNFAEPAAQAQAATPMQTIDTGAATAVMASFTTNLQNQSADVISKMGAYGQEVWNVTAVTAAYAANLQGQADNVIVRMGAWSEQTWSVAAITTSFAANLQSVADSAIANGWNLVNALASAASCAASFTMPAFAAPATAEPHASGGIFNSPHIGLVAEAGSEAIIPLSSRFRDRALGLYEQVGDYLGVQSGQPAPAFAGVGSGNMSVSVSGVNVSVSMPSAKIDEEALSWTIGNKIVKQIVNVMENKV